MNIRLDLAYDGSSFSGWQKQKNHASVQAALEDALSRCLGTSVQVVGSGRTDAGAHALCYTANFHCLTLPFPVDVLPKVIAPFLPPSILLLRAREVEEDFHARFSAWAREYVYVVWRGEFAYPMLRSYTLWLPSQLDTVMLAQACSLFVGEHNFRLFCYGYGREEKVNFVRRIFYFRVREKGNWLFFFIKGNGFLRGMIRTLVGVSLQMARHNLGEEDIKRALFLEQDIPTRLKKAVPAIGLYFKRAYY